MPVMNNVTVLVRRSELAVEPRLSILHKHRRSLLRRLEQAHRTALDDDRLPKLCLRLEANGDPRPRGAKRSTRFTTGPRAVA